MTSIEFIDREISSYKHLVAFSSNDAKKYYEECVVLLQQIKDELEAWEIVKQNFVLQWKDEDNASGYYLKYFGNKEYEILKKALEVK